MISLLFPLQLPVIALTTSYYLVPTHYYRVYSYSVVGIWGIETKIGTWVSLNSQNKAMLLTAAVLILVTQGGSYAKFHIFKLS